MRTADEAPPRPDELVERFYVKVYNLAYRTLGRHEDAEDVAQQTFLRAQVRLAELREPAAAGAWLYRIAANLCMDAIRQRKGDVSGSAGDEPAWISVPDSDRLGAPAQAAELRELRLRVWRAALMLPPQQRLALALRELHAMSYAQIAGALGSTVGAVETLLFRARKGFRRAYEASPEALPSDRACDWMLERLSASIDGELGFAEQARIDAHLPVCTNCQFASRELRATSRLYALVLLIAPNATAQTAVVALIVGSGTAGLAAGVLTAAGEGVPVALNGYMAVMANGMMASIAGTKLGLTVATTIAVVAFGTVGMTALPGDASPASPPAAVSASAAPMRASAPSVVDPAPATRQAPTGSLAAPRSTSVPSLPAMTADVAALSATPFPHRDSPGRDDTGLLRSDIAGAGGAVTSGASGVAAALAGSVASEADGVFSSNLLGDAHSTAETTETERVGAATTVPRDVALASPLGPGQPWPPMGKDSQPNPPGAAEQASDTAPSDTGPPEIISPQGTPMAPNVNAHAVAAARSAAAQPGGSPPDRPAGPPPSLAKPVSTPGSRPTTTPRLTAQPSLPPSRGGSPVAQAASAQAAAQPSTPMPGGSPSAQPAVTGGARGAPPGIASTPRPATTLRAPARATPAPKVSEVRATATASRRATPVSPQPSPGGGPPRGP